ncbi:MAG: hypothetical protein KDD67_10120 [Ignavibacteriae bacterium]|nr:hypothetical protein [Ignavibacteriota bacterium]MCB9216626.1 hypothetical protein [Ignavibacteria bacterium]
MKDNNLLPIGNEEAATLFLNYVLQRQNGTYEEQLKRFAEGKHNYLAKVEALQKAALSSVPSPFNDLIEFLDILSKDTVSGHFGGRLSAVVESLKPVGEIPNLRFEELDVRVKQTTAGEAKELALCLLVLLTTEKRKEIFEVLKLSLQNGGEENFYLEEWTQPQIIELQGLYQSLNRLTPKDELPTERTRLEIFLGKVREKGTPFYEFLCMNTEPKLPDCKEGERIKYTGTQKDLAYLLTKLYPELKSTPERMKRLAPLFMVRTKNGVFVNMEDRIGNMIVYGNRTDVPSPELATILL